MSVAKVNGGRCVDASYDQLSSPNDRNRLRRNSSLKDKSTVDYDDNSVDKWNPESVQISRNPSLDLRDRHRNPLQKAVKGVRKMFLKATTSSPNLSHRRRRLEEDLDPTPDQSHRSMPRLSVDPTELSPLNHPQKLPNCTLRNGRQPGAIGIHNHGNSCFLNAVIQCLSNTDLLVEYLLSDEMKDCIQKSGQSCSITRKLIALVGGLWTGTYDIEVSYLFKQAIGECAEQYSGTTQNDAQEFLLWLLDKVNEELYNFAGKDNELKSKYVRGRNNSNSIIFDLFEAKYRSTLTCPGCQQQSNTYDPFLSVSLPIQLKSRLPVYVTVAFMKPYYRQVLYGLMMNASDTVAQLRRMLSRKTGIKEKQLLLTQIYEGTFQSSLNDSELLVDLNSLDFMYAIEFHEDPGSNGNTFDDEYSGTETVCIVAVNRVRDGSRQGNRFGGPFRVDVTRDSTMLQLRGALLGGMYFMVPKGNMEQVLMNGQFSMRLISDFGKNTYLSDADELPLYAVAVDDALTLCSEDVPPHVKLVLEWQYTDYKRMLVNTHPPVHCDPSYEQIKASMQQKSFIDLQDCFSAFTQQEQLGDEDTWLCPNCHKHQHGTTKSLNLCSLPDIMIIHLKRFRQDGDNRSKLNTLIKFPITDLDMNHHLTKGQPPNNGQSDLIKQDDYVYDLYGVCNHDGVMSQGHYKAICKNPLNGHWYMYDDEKVSEVREDRIVTRMAYLLFYRRQQARSRCQTPLDMHISQLLGADVIKSEPRRVAISKSVTPNKNSITAHSNQSVRSPNHFNNSNASFRHQMNSSFIHVSRTSNSFHASLRKPPPRRIPAAQWTMDRRLVGSTSLAGRSTVTRSRTQPLQLKSSLPLNGNKIMNGKVEGKSSDDIVLSSPASLLTASAILQAVTKPASIKEPRLMFQKVPNDNVDSYSSADRMTPAIVQRPLNMWQQKAEKFVQESAV